MKKSIGMLLAVCLLFVQAACGGTSPQNRDWTRQGYFTDEGGNMLTVLRTEDGDEPGWYVAFTNGEDWIADSYSGILPQEGNVLHGVLPSNGDKTDLTVTVSEEGADGLLLAAEGGDTYRFAPLNMPQASIFVHISVEGSGSIAYAEGEAAPEIDPDYPFQSAQINLAEPAVHTLLARPDAGYLFAGWMKNGEGFSPEPQVAVLLDESADFVAVFEEDPDWQNPVMNFVGEYRCGSAHASIECFGKDEAWITIERSGGARETTSWVVSGRLDTDALRIEYPGCPKTVYLYDDNGEVKSDDTEYEDVSGAVVFNGDGTFTWHRDLPEGGEDWVFEWQPATAGGGSEPANPWREITEAEARELCPASFTVPDCAENARWSVLDVPSGASGVLVQLRFDLGGNRFTAREQRTGDEGADISGMYYDWTYQREEPLKNWADGRLVCHTFRFIGENEYADLCTWYDGGPGISYSVSVTAEDLDGFDLLAVAEALGG